ncbi:Nicotinamide mononucleotide adenylyltransferase [Colletotrichum trifolii]|uniref:Nicotinamide mononucleotide adenylyltransferase n=1 Tax=Colletotrichum trifolii TaxID=5466 RepID=A0A4R8RQ22_COLTR|nr:Nicotinamide mononucleotide adenylyltransferase [Colletotrichum trifolii]
MSTDTATRKSLTEMFNRALTSFQNSKDAFRVVATLPRHTDTPTPRRPASGSRVETLIVLDSSFNPPTLAHLRMARSAVRDLKDKRAARVLLLLAVNNADKKPEPVEFGTRLGLMDAFARDLQTEVEEGPGEVEVEVDLGLATVPFFHDKARVIAESGWYGTGGGGGGGLEQVYLAGFDTLIRIFDTKYYNTTTPEPEDEEEAVVPIRRALDPFFEQARLRVTMRVDDQWGGVEEQVGYLEGLKGGKLEEVGGRGQWCERVEMVQGGGAVVSSTKVREAAGRGDEDVLRELLSKGVRGWVLEEGLYKQEWRCLE